MQYLDQALGAVHGAERRLLGISSSWNKHPFLIGISQHHWASARLRMLLELSSALGTGHQASVLKRAADDFKIPIVVTNQVTANMDSAHPQAPGSAGEETVLAALGTLWAHAVNVRLVLEVRNNLRLVTVGPDVHAAGGCFFADPAHAGLQVGIDAGAWVLLGMG